jgi:hypothetical protein
MHEVWCGCDVVVEGLRARLIDGAQSGESVLGTPWTLSEVFVTIQELRPRKRITDVSPGRGRNASAMVRHGAPTCRLIWHQAQGTKGTP